MVGRLIYLMGPSGAGKDSLLEAARERLLASGCLITRRVITRSAEAAGEDAVAVSCREFEKRLLSGCFAMHWQANGLAYGIATEIDSWLAQGRHVLVNGSRGYLGEARQRYPGLLPIVLEVAPEVLRARLLSRGRESLDEIEARLARNARFVADGEGVARDNLIRLDNSGPLELTVTRLLQLVDESRITTG